MINISITSQGFLMYLYNSLSLLSILRQTEVCFMTLKVSLNFLYIKSCFIYSFFFRASFTWYNYFEICHLLPTNISLCRYTTICLSIQLLTDIWLFLAFWLLQLKLPWIFVYKSLCEYMFSLLFAKCLGGEQQCMRVSFTPHLCQCLLKWVLILAIIIGVSYMD